MWRLYMSYMKRNGHRPSKYRKRDMALVNWLKYNLKRRNRGLLKESRMERLNQLLAEAARLKEIKLKEQAEKEARKEARLWI